jgi:acid phosphatase (class A)
MRGAGCFLTVVLAACSAQQVAVAPSPASNPADSAALMAAARNSLGQPYLAAGQAIDSIALLPPPPAPGSAAEARDKEAMQGSLALRGSPRWEQAKIDADLLVPDSSAVMSCAAGFAIGVRATPAIEKLLRRSAADLGLSGSAAKRQYARPRPFMVNGEPSCTPDWEPLLRKDGSYPSGHSSVGYGWGLILAEIVPARATQLVARGRAYGDSRRVCNVHWLSDVEEGRVTAAATVARLHADPAFQQDLATAKAEAGRMANASKLDCAREDAALAPG